MFSKSGLATVALIAGSFLMSGLAVGEEFGRFEGSVQVEWLPDGREMKTLSKITYIDPDGLAWTVPVGTKTDGASTPQATWTMYPPFAGKYRKAALVHDYFCESKERSWQDTHDMFFYALRASGMDSVNSNIMWTAVYMQGPRWDIATKRSLQPPARKLPPEQAKRQIEMMAEWVRKTNPTRAEIKQALEEGKIQRLSDTVKQIR